MSNICFIARLFCVFLMERKFSEYSCPMKTDASNVEDTNIHHIKECLLPSCVASFDDWSGILRTRSFTLYKNDQDFNDISDSSMVSVSISSSSTICPCAVRTKQVSLYLLQALHQISTLEKTNSCQHSTLSDLMSKRPPQESLLLNAAQSMGSEVIDFHIWFHPGFLMQLRQAH